MRLALALLLFPALPFGPAIAPALAQVAPAGAQDEALLAHIVQVAFAQRRKTLRNNLKGVLDDDGFTALDIDPGIRPENLSVGGFVAIANYLSKKV